MHKMKLDIELVPKTSWYNNLRKYIDRKNWDKIRKETYSKYGSKCGICGAEGRLNSHEIWEYDDKKHIQKLKGFIALCNDCHMIKHIGFAGIQALKGLLDIDKLIEHFMKINKCDKKEFKRYKKEAFKQWKERSKYKWHVDLGEYKNIVKRKEI